MSEDRLEEALQAMRNENVNSEELAKAHERVWEKVGGQSAALCGEFRLQFQDYLAGRLDQNRLLLMEDHLSRCPQCRSQLAEQKTGRQTAVMPRRAVPGWPRWGTYAAAAALILAAVYFGRAHIDTLLAPRGPRATVASVRGNLYLLPQGKLKTGSAISEGEVIRTGPNSGAVLRLDDGSLVEVNERSELSLRAAWSGRAINLQRGDIIVRAAKQRHGFLRVQTRDSLASVKGTIFAVSAGLSGSVVSVIEGSVGVEQSGSEVLLSPGEQAASNPALVTSAEQAVSWSTDAETYIAMLTSLAKIEKQLAELPSPSMRTQSSLMRYMPASMVVYGAIPNLSSTISQAMALVEQQSAENPVFGQWWNSSQGQDLKKLMGKVQTITHLFQDEIVFGYSLGAPETNEQVPMIIAEVQPGKQDELRSELNTLIGQIDQSPPCYQLIEDLVVISGSDQSLQWLMAHLGQGAETPFAEAIAERYSRGAGWLMAMDMDAMLHQSGTAEEALINTGQVKYVFLERREPQGVEENQMTIAFKGPRMGIASFLADSGSGGAAEYISSDAIGAVYASTREPRQIFDELMALLGRSDPSSLGNITQVEASLGVSFADDLAASIGTESAFGLESLSAVSPTWVMAVLVNNPPTLEAFIRKLADAINLQAANAGKTKPLALLEEVVDGRTWTTMKSTSTPLAITWTYDSGYLVAASDRGAAQRALATRNGGSSLIWSPEFQQQLAGQAGLHPSGFAWLNTKGVLQNLAALVSNPVIHDLISERDPILVVFNATTEQIQAVSRTRLSGLIMDIMLLQGLGQAGSEAQTALP
jgi:hypothetical protein